MSASRSNNEQRIMSLTGISRTFSKTLRGNGLAHMMYLRSLQSWTKGGCYAWCRLRDNINSQQKYLVAVRREMKEHNK